MPKNIKLKTENFELNAITPLDGRYRSKTSQIAEYTSEYGLIKLRIEIETKYLAALSDAGIIRKLTVKEREYLLSFAENLTSEQVELVKEIERETRHDVKAVERALRKILVKTSMSDVIEMLHFGLTSWDINDSAYTLQLKRATENAVLPKLEKILAELAVWAEKYKAVPMLARTHGQAAVPTTLGKEFAVFAVRLNKQIKELKQQKLTGKLNGAVGNYNALNLAYPNVDWIKFSEKFIKSLGLETNLYTTQINPYDDLAEYFQNYERINNILIGFAQDIWRYVSDNWLVQANIKGEVGSSAMPQKVNPIDFENAEGNLGMANALLEFMARKLPVSRLQRDLSDSTVLRNIGTVLGFSLVGYESLISGLLRIKPNLPEIEQDLNRDWSILTEGVQTILRKARVSDPYSLIAKLSRGKHIDQKHWQTWIKSLPIEQKYKRELERLTPSNYTGLAQKITEKAIREIRIKK